MTLKLPAGEYVFAADLQHGGTAAGDRLKFHVSDPADLPRGRGDLAVWGLEGRIVEWLIARGYSCGDMDPKSSPRSLIVVGRPKYSKESWDLLEARVRQGQTALLLSARPFLTQAPISGGEVVAPANLPLGGILKGREFHDWLYHKDIVAKRHSVFDGLQSGGILDWHYYDQVVGHDLFDCGKPPDEVIAAAFAVGYCVGGGYSSGMVIGSQRLDKGRLVFCSMPVLDHIDSHPAADRLLLNLVQHAQGLAAAAG